MEELSHRHLVARPSADWLIGAAALGAVALRSPSAARRKWSEELSLSYRFVYHARLTARIEPRPTTQDILLIKYKLWNAVQTVRNADVKLPRKNFRTQSQPDTRDTAEILNLPHHEPNRNLSHG